MRSSDRCRSARSSSWKDSVPIALEAAASLRGRSLSAEGVSVVDMGGAKNVGRFLERFGPPGLDLALAGLYDAAAEPDLRRALERVGLGSELSRPDMERLGFFACVEDLEDELIRAIGLDAVLDVIQHAASSGPSEPSASSRSGGSGPSRSA